MMEKVNDFLVAIFYLAVEAGFLLFTENTVSSVKAI